MSAPAQREAMTVEELYRLPDDGQRYELAHGRLVSEPPPGIRHGCVAMRLGALLDSFVRTHQAGLIVSCDAGFVLHRSPDTVRAPDLAIIRRRRYLALEDNRKAMPGAPELAIEVLSPGNRWPEVHAKVADYLAAGTALVWVVDPEIAQVHCYRTLLEPHMLTGSQSLTARDLLPGFSVPVSELFTI